MWVQPSPLCRLRAPRTAVKVKRRCAFPRRDHPESDRTSVRRNVDAEAPDPGVSVPDVER